MFRYCRIGNWKDILAKECNPGTQNPGKPSHFQTCKPRFESRQKPGFKGLILGV